MSLAGFETFIVDKTERYLTLRKRRRLKRKARPRRLHPVLDWLISIFIIILCVIFINMFLFQNYRIPSESMVPELQNGDLLFVEKLSFGPEILPGKIKLPPLRAPVRGEVVSFESAIYAQQGPFVELLDRFVYFITFSLVNLKTDGSNNALKDLLIKRVIGLGGDRVREFRSRFEIMPVCEDAWVPEKQLVMKSGVYYTIPGDNNGNSQPFYRRSLAGQLEKILIRAEVRGEPEYFDVQQSLFERSPADPWAAGEWHKRELGYYVPENMFFPMGDNRERSNDARYFGPVAMSRIQGKALFRFFPLSRFGKIE